MLKKFQAVITVISLMIGLCYSTSVLSAAAPSISPSATTIFAGQSIRFEFSGLEDGLTFAVLPGKENGAIAAYSPLLGYKALTSSTTSQTVSITTAGYYVAAIWKSGWNFVEQIPIVVKECPTLTSDSTNVAIGSNVKFMFSNVESGMEFGVLPGREDGSIASYSPIKGYKALNSGMNSQTVTMNETGYYVAAIWTSGWNFLAQLPITVSEYVKSAKIDKSEYYETDIISVTTENWSSEDGDFFAVYDASVTDITVDTQAVYSSASEPGLESYDVDTAGWQPGEYRLVAFDSGDYGSKYIADITFTLYINKKVSIDKTEYTTDDVISVITNGWSVEGKEFIRIYPYPAKAYNSGFVADTYGTVWGRDTYKFYPKEWTPGTYQLIAFEYTGWKVINSIVFEITEPEKGPYEISGNTLTVNEETVLDLSAAVPEPQIGKLFIGWREQSGQPAANNYSYPAGTVLTAEFIDYNAQEVTDFKITGKEIRTEISVGLRFTVELSDAFYALLPGAAEFGAAVIPSEILNENDWADLEIGRSYNYGGESYFSKIITAERIFDISDGAKSYTLCVTGISDEKLMRQYTARGYIRYTDINGIEKILYTDYASASVYATARAELGTDGLSEEKRIALENIVAVAEEIHDSYYSGEKITVAGSPDSPLSYVYKLSDEGIYIREAVINAGLETPIEIVQLSDLHFNRLNDYDMLLKNPTVLSTYDMRTLAANGASAKQTRAAVDFARTADGVVITGDILDYLSYGNIEMMYKEIWDIIPDAVLTAGNHEYLQKMLGVMPETLSTEERWDILNNVWKHDINYFSKVVGNKVMLIQLNNGEGKFYESQIALLSADIETARENGYTVLMFMHEPICTNNAEDDSVLPIRVDSDASGVNFYNGQVGGYGADEATVAVCNIISSNADVIKGVFNGHMHNDYYTEISAHTESGERTFIPQYTSTGGFYNNGCAIKIIVR